MSALIRSLLAVSVITSHWENSHCCALGSHIWSWAQGWENLKNLYKDGFKHTWNSSNEGVNRSVCISVILYFISFFRIAHELSRAGTSLPALQSHPSSQSADKIAALEFSRESLQIVISIVLSCNNELMSGLRKQRQDDRRFEASLDYVSETSSNTQIKT